MFEQDWHKRQAHSAIQWEGDDEEDEQRNNTWTLLQTYCAETPIQANERPAAVEVPMEEDLPDGLPKLVGIIDLVRAGGRIVDFKTSGQTLLRRQTVTLALPGWTFRGHDSACCVLRDALSSMHDNAAYLLHIVKCMQYEIPSKSMQVVYSK